MSFSIRAAHLLAVILLLVLASEKNARAADYVIQISVDGLGSSYLQELLDLGEAPNFERLRTEGSGTLNARTDYDYTITLPNHTAMLTGRPVLDKFEDPASGHLWTDNGDTVDPITLHSNRGFYVSSTFDVAHDAGLSTALYSSKPKFSIYDRSYNATYGAPDLVGVDNGRDKIDVTHLTDFDSESLMGSFVADMSAAPTNYTFLHFHDTDSVGHASGWGSAQYLTALRTVDAYLGQVLDLIAASSEMVGHTAIVLTADHGGDIDFDHSDPTKPIDYTIPFLVWGDGVAAGDDFYELNLTTRLDPGTSRPDYSTSELAPIRNGDSGNLALSLLALDAIPGSSINRNQDLAVVAVPEPSMTGFFVMAGLAATLGSRLRCKPAQQK